MWLSARILDRKNNWNIIRIPAKLGPSTAAVHSLHQNVLSKSIYNLPQALSYCLQLSDVRPQLFETI